MSAKIEDNNNKEITDNILLNNGQQEHNHSSLKNDKFKGLTSEQIIKKYEDVINSREKQYHELSKEIKKLNNTIKILKEKKEKSKINNDKLKEVFSKYESILKQELRNKEFDFMKLTNLENKYDDLQNKIQEAAQQSCNIIIDLRRSKMLEEKAVRTYEREFMKSKGLKRMKIIKKDGELLDFHK